MTLHEFECSLIDETFRLDALHRPHPRSRSLTNLEVRLLLEHFRIDLPKAPGLWFKMHGWNLIVEDLNYNEEDV